MGGRARCQQIFIEIPMSAAVDDLYALDVRDKLDAFVAA